MPISEQQAKIIEALIHHKKLTTELYRAYEKRSQRDSTFWASLAVEKKTHYQWIENQLIKLKAGKISMNQTRFSLQALQSALSFIRDQIKKANDPKADISTKQALSFASQLEGAIIESRFYEVFIDPSNEYKLLAKKFADHAEANKARIIQRMNER